MQLEILILLMVIIGIAGIVWHNKAKKKEKKKNQNYANDPQRQVEAAQRVIDEALLAELVAQWMATPGGILKGQIDALRIKLGYSNDQNG